MMGQQPGRAKRPGPSLRIALPILVIGVILGVVSLVSFASDIGHDYGSTHVVQTPIVDHVNCKSGATYEVFGPSGSAAVSPTTVTVTGPGGTAIPVAYSSGQELSPTINGVAYSAKVSFVADTTGAYQVQVTATTTILIAPSFESEVGQHQGLAFGITGGILLGIIGIVLLIVGSVRRSKAKRLGYGPQGPGGSGMAPPQWNPYGGAYTPGGSPTSYGLPGYSPPGYPPPGSAPGYPPPGPQGYPPPTPQGYPPPGSQQPTYPPPGAGSTPPAPYPPPGPTPPANGGQPSGWPQPSGSALPAPNPQPERPPGWPQSSDN